MPARTPATPPASTPQVADPIAVRLSILVRISPDKWEQPKPEGEQESTPFDFEQVVKGLTSAGIPEGTAKTMAEQLRPKASDTDPHAPSVVRTQVREYMLAQVQALKPLVDAGAVVVDADRQPAKPATAAAPASTPPATAPASASK